MFACFFYICAALAERGKRRRERRRETAEGKCEAVFSLEEEGAEWKISQTSDVFENASKRFKALKYRANRLVYQ